MHIQTVIFNLRNIRDADHRRACDGLARVLARTPALISMWLADEDSNTYGGPYTWVDGRRWRRISEATSSSPSWPIRTWRNMTSRNFEVLEGPSRITQALATAVELIDRECTLTEWSTRSAS